MDESGVPAPNGTADEILRIQMVIVRTFWLTASDS